jgi:hypothetical protein
VLRRTALKAFRKCLIVVDTRSLPLQDELPRRMHRYIHGRGIRACAVASVVMAVISAFPCSDPQSRSGRAGTIVRLHHTGWTSSLRTIVCFTALVGIEHLLLASRPSSASNTCCVPSGPWIGITPYRIYTVSHLLRPVVVKRPRMKRDPKREPFASV